MNPHSVSPDNKDERPSTAEGGIAIIGISGRYPGAPTLDALWQNLRNGVDAVGEMKGDRWDLGWQHPDPQRPARVYTKSGGFLDRIDGFDAEFFGMSPREVKQMDPQQRLLLELAWEALEDAGIPPRAQAGSQMGVYVGISSSDYASLDGVMPDAYTNTGGAFSIAANRISYFFDFHGPSVAVDTACSSSLVCVHEACRSLLDGECSMALAGGVHIMSHIRLWLGFAKASMLSPTGRCKSFDASGDGFVRAEGGGFVLLKPLAAAERDGDRILGVIVGSGVNSDGRTMGLSLPNGEAQEQLLRSVYGKCHTKPEDVVYVEAHGTGTAVGDPIECGALGRVLGTPRSDGSPCLIGSIKSNIGHLEAGSGIAGLTKAVLTLQHGEIPGNLHFNTPNPKIDFENWKLEVVTKTTKLPRKESPVVVGVNSFGFGGTNAHVALKEYRKIAAKPATVNGAAANGSLPASKKAGAAESILCLSGNSEAALKDVAKAYVSLLRSDSKVSWAAICAATATGRSPLRYRLALSAATKEDAIDKLEGYLAGTPTARMAMGTAANATVPVAFVYSGNGPQWWGMGRELLAENAVFRAELEAVDAIFAPLAGWSLLDEMRKPESESRIALTEVAQPMLFAMQLGLTQVLREAGIEPAAVVGHSVGEAASAWASGALTREQATRVIYHRSMEQAKTAGLGKMAALGVGPDEAREAIQRIPGWLELAAINAPQSVTVAGDATALEELVKAMTAAGKFARMLQLNYPFHTKAMEPIRGGLLEDLHRLAPKASKVPFISTVDGTEKDGRELDAEYWYRNVREPVRFDDAIAHLLKNSGFTLFLEIGPHPVLRDYVAQSAKALDLQVGAFQTLRRPGAKGPEPESDNLATAICACYANGGGNIAELFERPAPLPALPLYPWQHARHWRGEVPLPYIWSSFEREQELLGHRVNAAEGLWENLLDVNQLPYLKDHVVQGSVLFPAAGYIELVLQATQSAFGKGLLIIDDFDVSRPLAISAHTDPMIQTYLNVKDGEVEVSSRTDLESREWTRHIRTRASRLEKPAGLENVNLAEVCSRTPCAVSGEEHYAASRMRALEYGPHFQGVSKVLLSPPGAQQREALAEIHVEELDAGGLAGYLSHPAILDSCIQVMISLVHQNDKSNASTIPVHVGRITSYAPLPSRVFCHVTMRSESERSAVADFRVMDQDGNVLLDLRDARCQKVNFQNAAHASLCSEWWRPDSTTPNFEPLSDLPSPAFIQKEVAGELAPIAEANERAAFYRDIRPQLEELARAYGTQALAALAPKDEAFDISRLARKAGVKRDRIPLLQKVVRLAEHDGQLTQSGGKWRWNPDKTPSDPTELWRRLFENHPRYCAELLLASGVSERLTAELAGATLEPASSLIDQVSDTAPLQAVYNQIVRATIEKLTASWPADRPVRILELNGGGGGLTAWVAPVLKPARTDYFWTDSAEAAVGRAEHRFTAFPFMRFATLDTTQEFVDQGSPATYFDLVIGLEIVGDSEALGRIQRVMAPDALLLSIERRADDFQDLLFDCKGGDWVAELREAGFEAATVLDDSRACPEGQQTQQAVVLAQLAASTTKARKAANEHPQARWLLVCEGNDEVGFAVEVAKALEKHGQAVAGIVKRDQPQQAISEALEGGAETQIVYLAAPAVAGKTLVATQEDRCWRALEIAQATEKVRYDGKTCHLTLVTGGAFATANGEVSLDPSQSALWGLGRVLTNEHPALDLRMVDMHYAMTSSQESEWLAEELLRRDRETEVQLAAGIRYVNRGHMETSASMARQSAKPSGAFALDFEPRGGLDSLYLREAARLTPAADEVEIEVEAAGLNFRDVLWTMGMLPEEAVEHGFSGPTIGMECAGRVARVGSSVTSLKAGDRVVAFASNCFGSHVTTKAGAAATIPDNVDLTGAATIPTAFLTAYYALDYLARLEAGETILIHGAAGGVGMAAIQIAKLKGAKVIGTAGSRRKRRMLEMLGADHVLNSRSLEFADEVMKLTGGVGVDAVLNSLAGEAITKSLQCLRPFGRFLEIGKRDLYGNSHIGLRPFRNNLSYFGIDADTLLVERAGLAQKLFGEVIALFAAGKLHPLPYQAIPVSRAAEAFRAMQQSRHVGKILVSMKADKASSLAVVSRGKVVKANATYLVTGGLGGFGLATAEWLVEQGARSLALVGRKGASTDEAKAGIARMEAMGANVHAFAADISDSEAVDKMLTAIRAEMPPLTGIVHAAAVIEDAAALNLTPEQLQRVFNPKIGGAWNLHLGTLKDPIEFFVLYSSSAGLVGNPGQAAYAAANLYLDGLALYRRSLGLPALAVGWGAIKDAGFLTRHQEVAKILKTRSGLDAIPAKDALNTLGRLISLGATRVAAGLFDWQRVRHGLPSAVSPRFASMIPKGAMASAQTEETLADVLRKTPVAEQRGLTLERVREHAARVLGTAAAQINVDQPLAELGLDSLMAVELASALERDLGQPVSVMQMLSAGTLAAIADLAMKAIGLGGDAEQGSTRKPVAQASSKAILEELRA